MKIRPLTKDDFEQALEILVAAFLDTDFHKYIAPDDEERLKFMRMSFRFRLTNSLLYHKIECALSDAGSLMGLVVWVPPDDGGAPSRAPVRETPPRTLEEALQTLSPDLQRRFSEFYNLMREEHKRFAPAGAWDIAPVAVLPRYQGQGAASALLKRGLAKIKAAGDRCCLATQSQANVVYYERLGFKTLSCAQIHNEIYTWTMLY